MVDDIKNLMTRLILEHIQKHPGIDFIYATKNKEYDKDTRAIVCAVCGEEFVRSKKKIIGIEDFINILEKYHMNDISVIQRDIGELKILDIDIRIVENK